MSKKRLMPILIATVFVLFCRIGVAQPEFRFDRLTPYHGLSQSSVTAITQGKHGYLWVGTLDGLNKFDGSNFKVYRHSPDDSTSLPGNEIGRLFIDPAQQLWIVTPGFISRYQAFEDNFMNYPLHEPGNMDSPLKVRAFYCTAADTLMLSTQRGLFWFSCRNGTYGQYPRHQQFPSVHSYYRNDQNTEFIITEPVNHDPGYQLVSRKKNEPAWQTLLHHLRHIKGTIVPRSGVFYQTRDGVYRIRPETQELIQIAVLQSDGRFDEFKQHLMQRANGDFWVMHGVIDVFDTAFQFRNRIPQIDHNPQSLPGYLSTQFETQDGVVWIGSNGLGLYKYNPLISVFHYMSMFPGSSITLSNEFVTSIFTNDDRVVYVGTLAGLDVIDKQKNTVQHYQINTSVDQTAGVTRLIASASGRLYVGTTRGLRWFDGRRLVPLGLPLLDSDRIQDLSLTADGKLIVASNKNLMQFDPTSQKITIISSQNTLVTRKIGDTFWTEHEGKLVLYREGSTQPYKVYGFSANKPGSFPFVWAKSFFVDSQKNIWIGTAGQGLMRFNARTETFDIFDQRNGLPNQVVYGILEDQDGYLWLSTNNGICVFDRQRAQAVRNFYQQDGIQANEFNSGAYFASPAGRFYFGGVQGLTSFEPATARAIKYPIPTTVVRSILVNNQRVDHLEKGQQVKTIMNGATLNLTYKERNFGVEVMGLGFNAPSRTQYQFRLENFIDEWVTIGNRNDIMFTNIPPGTYRLQVKCSNGFGEWEEEGLNLTLVVDAPFWRRKDVMAIGLLFVAAIAYGIYVIRTSNLREQKKYLEHVVTERTYELQMRSDEVNTQNKEITRQNEELATQAEAIEQRNLELERVKNSLEQRVQERTQTLQTVNEALVEHNNRLEQFTYITAHNLRGPVARLKGLLNIFERDPSEQIVSHLNVSVSSLDEVINDLNMVLAIRKGGNTPFERVSLRHEFELVIQTLEEDIRAGAITIEHIGQHDAMVMGMKPYVFSVFYNLVHNAIKYRNHRRPLVITCSCHPEDGFVNVQIADNGVGIDMTYAREKIFGLYQRFNTNTQGKGLGLFLVKTHIEAMGGTIAVESKLDVGTTFTMRIPLAT